MGPSPSLVGAGFPESFQRTTSEASDLLFCNDTSSESTPQSEVDLDEGSLASPRLAIQIPKRGASPELYQRRESRSSVMRLENILNDVSISHASDPLNPRSRSLGRSPMQSPSELDPTTPSSPAFSKHRSVTPDETVKKKKVKMHRCTECHKEFPRPSGLRTHMNTHTKEKPFPCTFPGCTRTFSVVSNAKRHMRTHGLGVSADDGDQSAIPYVVGFEEPVVVGLPDPSIPSAAGLGGALGADGVGGVGGGLAGVGGGGGTRQPFRLRWIPGPTSAAVGHAKHLQTRRTSPESARTRSVVIVEGDLRDPALGLTGSRMRGWSVDGG